MTLSPKGYCRCCQSADVVEDCADGSNVSMNRNQDRKVMVSPKLASCATTTLDGLLIGKNLTHLAEWPNAKCCNRHEPKSNYQLPPSNGMDLATFSVRLGQLQARKPPFS